MKKIALILSVCICFFVLIFLSKYDTWGVSEGLCIYHDNSTIVALLLACALFAVNFLLFLKDKKSISNIIFIIVSASFVIYWHPTMYNYSINFLLKHTNIQIEQLGDMARCELQRNDDLSLQKPRNFK
ncbi:hypothetical protein [Moraxella marmotae]|uniref:hypothetical protein n=1 Tax=Moraxella marmotae TaxID=3344520 RepID=UPI0035F39A14